MVIILYFTFRFGRLVDGPGLIEHHKGPEKETNKPRKGKYLDNDSFQSGDDDDGKSDLPNIKEELIEEFDDESTGEADNEQRGNLRMGIGFPLEYRVR